MLINEIKAAEKLIRASDFTFEKIIAFLEKLSQFTPFPDSESTTYTNTLSSILQNTIIPKLAQLDEVEKQFQLHKAICRTLVNMFTTRSIWAHFE